VADSTFREGRSWPVVHSSQSFLAAAGLRLRPSLPSPPYRACRHLTFVPGLFLVCAKTRCDVDACAQGLVVQLENVSSPVMMVVGGGKRVRRGQRPALPRLILYPPARPLSSPIFLVWLIHRGFDLHHPQPCHIWLFSCVRCIIGKISTRALTPASSTLLQPFITVLYLYISSIHYVLDPPTS
jgi:hypothetical protein